MTLLPEGVELESKDTAKGKTKFRYREYFYKAMYHGEKRAHILQRTAEMMVRAMANLGLDVVITRGSNWLQMTGTVEKTTFGSMMTTEFMGWCSVGDMTLRDLMMLPTRVAARGSKAKSG